MFIACHSTPDDQPPEETKSIIAGPGKGTRIMASNLRGAGSQLQACWINTGEHSGRDQELEPSLLAFGLNTKKLKR